MLLPLHKTSPLLATLFLLATAWPVLAQTTEGKWSVPAKHNDTQRALTWSATAPLLGKATAYSVNFFCDPITTRQASGALGFDLTVADAVKLKPFDFEAFEGPDATAGGKKLLQASIERSGKPALTFRTAVSGGSTDGSNFAFSATDLSREANSTAKSILRALGDGAQVLKITITDSRNAKLKLEFNVPVAGKEADFKALLAGLK